MDKLLRLNAFRQELYNSFGPARDALFELTDAVLTTPAAASFAELSLAPLFRRRWPSLYEALQDGRPDPGAFLQLALRYVPETTLDCPVLIGDHTVWPRLSARTLQGRTVEHHPTRQQRLSQGDPITVGLGYSTLALLAERPPSGPLEARGNAQARAASWVLPLLHERIEPQMTPLVRAADQLGRLCRALKPHAPGRPLSLWDSEYGCARFLRLTAEINCDKLMRLRSNRCLYGPPPPYPGHGPPFKHGALFKLSDPETWPLPEKLLEFTDARWGRVWLRRWRRLHFQQTPEIEMDVVLVERLEGPDTRRRPKRLWLVYVGETEHSLEQVWRLYMLRFRIEHLYRFMKQRLHWTLPRLATVEQADRWSALFVPMLLELYLAREVIAGRPLPWQKPLSAEGLTPGRVCSGFAGIIAAIGTPASVPKRRGKSPGWPTGRVRRRRDRYPVVRKKKRAASTQRSQAR